MQNRSVLIACVILIGRLETWSTLNTWEEGLVSFSILQLSMEFYGSDL